MPPTGDLAHNPGMCPDWELNQWPFDPQASTQSTEPHQPGQIDLIYVKLKNVLDRLTYLNIFLHAKWFGLVTTFRELVLGLWTS